MTIEIYADAGFRHQDPQIAVVAYNISLGGSRIEGAEEVFAEDVIDAEMVAIVRALQIATTYRELFEADDIRIYSDSLMGIRALKGAVKNSKYKSTAHDFNAIKGILKQKLHLTHIAQAKKNKRKNAAKEHQACHDRLIVLLRQLVSERQIENQNEYNGRQTEGLPG